MKIINLQEAEERELVPGYFGKFIHSERTTIVHWRILANHPLAEHSHPHEQVVHVREGTFDLTVAGVKHTLTAGSMLVIPPDVPHAGVGLTDCRITDTFCPVREDYRF